MHSGSIRCFLNIPILTVNDERNHLIAKVFKWRQQVHIFMNEMALHGHKHIAIILWVVTFLNYCDEQKKKKKRAHGKEYGRGDIRV